MSLQGKTVLQIIPSLDSGGAERTTVEIAAAIVAAGGRAMVMTSGGRLCADVERIGGEILYAPMRSKNPLVIAGNAGRIASVGRDRNVDLLHVRSRAPAWSALAAARALKRPLAATYHGAYASRSPLKRLYNSSMARADLVIANSEFTAESIRKLYPDAERRLVVIPRGADLETFNPEAVAEARVDALAKSWGVVRGREFIALLPARLTDWKGHLVAIEAAARLADDRLRLIFAGDDQGERGARRAIEAAIEAKALTGRMRLVGHCADMPAAYALSDVVLSPSTRPEAFGRVAVEAGAMGRTVIAADHGGGRETVRHGETGILVPPGDAGALAAALSTLLGMGPAGRAELGGRARRWVGEHFSTASMAQLTINAYQRLLADWGSAKGLGR